MVSSGWGQSPARLLVSTWMPGKPGDLGDPASKSQVDIGAMLPVTLRPDQSGAKPHLGLSRGFQEPKPHMPIPDGDKVAAVLREGESDDST